MKTQLFFLVMLASLLTLNGFAQVAVNTDASNPDASAMLDVKSTVKGLLIPRMTESERELVINPANGLMVYQTDGDNGFYFFNGIEWKIVGSGAFSIDDLSDGKTGGYSVFLGQGAGANDDGTSNQNVAVGYQSLNKNTTGYYNTANGYKSLFSNTTGWHNTASGYRSLNSNTTGNFNTAIGFQSLYHNTTGGYNTASGEYSLFNNTSGTRNTAVGRSALYSNVSGKYNLSLGYTSQYMRTTGNYNLAVGASSGYYNTIGYNNVILGNAADYYNTEGSDNTIIGFKAGYGSSGVVHNGNIFIGNKAGYNELTSNKLYIQNSDTSKPLIYGDFETRELGFNGKVGIGTHAPLSQLHIHDPNNTNSKVYITPKNIYSGDSATLFLAEDNDATYGMYWMYDGSGNEMELWGKMNTTFNGPHLKIKRDNGMVAIGDYYADGYRLSVDGKIMCEEVRVSLQDDWPDYVFHKNYDLLSVERLEEYIDSNGHLPNIPSSDAIENSGLEVGEMQRLMMEKIEELTLYIIEQQKHIEELEGKIDKISER